MTSRLHLIGAGLGATPLTTTSIAATQSSAQTAQRADQQIADARGRAIDQVSEMRKHCNRMVSQMMCQLLQ